VVAYADAFIDESGQRSTTSKSSDHFVMSGVVIPRKQLPDARALLAGMRKDLRRSPNDEISQANPRISSVDTGDVEPRLRDAEKDRLAGPVLPPPPPPNV
jgi:hypothetical protein